MSSARKPRPSHVSSGGPVGHFRDPAGPRGANDRFLFLAVELLRRRRTRQDGRIRIAVSPTQRARWRFEFEPLDQGLVLRMVHKTVQRDRERGFRETLDDVASLQDFATIPIGREPERSEIVDGVTDYERVVVGLGDFMTEASDVCESRAEQPRTDPAGIIQDPAAFRIAARFKKVRVEPEERRMCGKRLAIC